MKLFDLINPLKLVEVFTFSFGGGGGGGGTPFYANQDKLFGTQADIAQNLYNQYAGLAPGYLQNSMDMTNEAMNGSLASRARNTAAADVNASISTANNDTLRQLQSYGAVGDPSSNKSLDVMSQNAIKGAAMRAGAMNQANQWAEDQKWNRNAGAYGQISGMGTGAMQGMGSAGGGYGQMAGQASANSAANATGFGKFGAAMASGSKWASGGHITHAAHQRKLGLHLASGGVAQYVSPMKKVDWRSMPTTANPGGRGPNPLAAIAAGAAPHVMGAAVRDLLKGSDGRIYKNARNMYDDATRPYASEYTVENQPQQSQEYPYAEDAPLIDASTGATADQLAYTGSDYSASTGSDTFNGYGSQTSDWSSGFGEETVIPEPGFARGGPIRKRGLKLADGAYIDNSQYEYDPERYYVDGPGAGERAANTAGNMALSAGAQQGAKAAYKWATTPSADQSLVSSSAETPGVATTSAVENTGAGMTSTTLAEPAGAAATDAAASTTGAAATDAAATAATTAATDAAASATGAALTDAAATTATTAATDAAATVAASEAAAAATAATAGEAAVGTAAAANSWNPVGWIIGAGLLASQLFKKDGGYIKGRGLRLADGGWAQPIDETGMQNASDPYGHVGKPDDSFGERVGNTLERGPGQAASHDILGQDTPEDPNIHQQAATSTGDPLVTNLVNKMFAKGGRVDFTPGGKVTGPGTETSDDIPAWLSDGEYVLNAEAVKLVGKDRLEKINNKGLEVREAKQNMFACGGAMKHGVKLAGGGFLGGNLGIAMGAGVDQWNKQQQIDQHQQQIDLQKQNAERLGKLADMQAKEFEYKEKQLKDADDFRNQWKALTEGEAEARSGAMDSHIARSNAWADPQNQLTPEQEGIIRNNFKPEVPNALQSKVDLLNSYGKTKEANELVSQDKTDKITARLPDLMRSGASPQQAFAEVAAIDPSKAVQLFGNYELGKDRIESGLQRVQANIQAQAERQYAALAAKLAVANGKASKSGSGNGAGEEGDDRAIKSIDNVLHKDYVLTVGKGEEAKQYTGPELAQIAHGYYGDLRANKVSPEFAARIATNLAKGAYDPSQSEYSALPDVNEDGVPVVNIFNKKGAREATLYGKGNGFDNGVANPTAFLGGDAAKTWAATRANAALNQFGNAQAIREAAAKSDADIVRDVEAKLAEVKQSNPNISEMDLKQGAEKLRARALNFRGHAQEWVKQNQDKPGAASGENDKRQTWDSFDEAQLWKLKSDRDRSSNKNLFAKEIAELEARKSASKPSMGIRTLRGIANQSWSGVPMETQAVP